MIGIGKKLKLAREKAQISNKKIADALNLSSNNSCNSVINMLRLMEKEKHLPHLKRLLVLSELYDVSPAWLVSCEKEEEELLELFSKLKLKEKKEFLKEMKENWNLE